MKLPDLFLRSLFFLCTLVLFVDCKKSAKQRLDALLEQESFISVAILCEKEKSELLDRVSECETSLQKSRETIEKITNRALDLGITRVIVEANQGKEIEELLRLNTNLGIQYFEIWKQSVILE